MENKQKEQTRKDLELNKLEKVNGGVVVPAKPDEHDDNRDPGNGGGGATGGW